MQGKIIRGIAGFYYIYVAESGIYECKAKGIFRKEKRKPLVGDQVEIEVLDEKEKLGNITDILPRRNELIRPAVANVDQALVIFAAAQPEPNYNLLDRFLIMMERQDVPVSICFNKKDLVSETCLQQLKQHYAGCSDQILFTSAEHQEGIEAIAQFLHNRTTVVAGPSGVGKSSLINLLQENIRMDTGAVSEKIGRGRHTTRHSELICVADHTYVIDTPGFSSLYTQDFAAEELRFYFREFQEYEGGCRFHGCCHVHEPGCMVKEAVELEKISHIRYDNYVELFNELKEQRRY